MKIPKMIMKKTRVNVNFRNKITDNIHVTSKIDSN